MDIEAIRTIGLVGAGNIGTAVARLALAAGYEVVLSNSRGPETLTDLVTSLGAGASADTAAGAAARGDLVVVTIPLHAIGSLPVEPLAGKVVVDTNNYYPGRDGAFPRLDDHSATSSGLLQELLASSYVVKGFNHIGSADLETQVQPTGSPGRRALSLFGGSPAVDTVAAWLDRLGYDAVVGGGLEESWRIEPDTPGYGPRLDADGLRKALADATR